MHVAHAMASEHRAIPSTPDFTPSKLHRRSGMKDRKRIRRSQRESIPCPLVRQAPLSRHQATHLRRLRWLRMRRRLSIRSRCRTQLKENVQNVRWRRVHYRGSLDGLSTLHRPLSSHRTSTYRSCPSSLGRLHNPVVDYFAYQPCCGSLLMRGTSSAVSNYVPLSFVSTLRNTDHTKTACSLGSHDMCTEYSLCPGARVGQSSMSGQ